MATSNACKPTLASSQIEKISGEKSCSFSQRFVNTRSACDLLVQWPESPESADNRFARPCPPGEQGIRRLSGPASCRGRGQRGGAVEINWSSPAWRSVESDVRGTVLPAESPRITLPHSTKYLDISFGTSTARHSTSTVTVRSSRCASSAPWTPGVVVVGLWSHLEGESAAASRAVDLSPPEGLRLNLASRCDANPIEVRAILRLMPRSHGSNRPLRQNPRTSLAYAVAVHIGPRK